MADQMNLPTSLEPIAVSQDGKVQWVVSNVWYKYFLSLSALLGNLVGGVLGFTSENNVTATGASQADAFPATTEWIVVTNTPPGSGVMISAFGAGVANSVFNRGGNPLNVYPPPGGEIDRLGIDTPYVLANNKMQVISQIDNDSFLSMQLG